jgi:hypothetical protein
VERARGGRKEYGKEGIMSMEKEKN